MSALVSEVMSKDTDFRYKFFNVTFLLRLAILLNQDYGGHKSRKTSEHGDQDFHPLEAVASILMRHFCLPHHRGCPNCLPISDEP